MTINWQTFSPRQTVLGFETPCFPTPSLPPIVTMLISLQKHLRYDSTVDWEGGKYKFAGLNIHAVEQVLRN